MLFEAEIADLIEFARQDYLKFFEKLPEGPGYLEPIFELKALDNQKFIKIVEVTGGKPSRVWGFISKGVDGKFKAGDLLKAANWNAPAKNFARGSVLDKAVWPATVKWTGIR